jgi:hypothetical protein
MKTLLRGDNANFTSISLQLLLNNLLSNLPETIALNKIVIDNAVSSEFKMPADVVSVIDELLTTMLKNVWPPFHSVSLIHQSERSIPAD